MSKFILIDNTLLSYYIVIICVSLSSSGCKNSSLIPVCRSNQGNRTICISPDSLCDGIWDCESGEDERDYCGDYTRPDYNGDSRPDNSASHSDYSEPVEYWASRVWIQSINNVLLQCIVRAIPTYMYVHVHVLSSYIIQLPVVCPEFKCGDKNRCCLPYYLVCDGSKDCDNGHDESSEICGESWLY